MERKPILENLGHGLRVWAHPELEDAKADETLCSACCLREDCDLLAEVEAVESDRRLGLLVTSCAEFLPVLEREEG